ncbi:MAG: dockerin type I repeat-containing protein [Prevotella sp.]
MRPIICIVMFFTTAAVLRAQDSGWSVNERDYQYDMTVYAQLSLSGSVVDNYSNYEVGAFVGDECRGVAELNTQDGYTWLYLRVRSNVSSGESVTLKVYDKTTGKTYRVVETIDFQSQGMVGQPSTPMTATVKTYTLGDVNDDGTINITDVTSILTLMAGKTEDNLIVEAADVNEDGVVNISDVTSVLSIMAGK